METHRVLVLSLLLVLLYAVTPPFCHCFTVIMSDANAVSGRQPGSPTPNTGTKTDPQEQEAVYDIMRATGNDWAVAIPDVCRGRWHGIECMPDNNNIFHIVSLAFGTLSDDTAFPTCDPNRSIISPSITKLPHLRTLFFYRCLGGNPQPIPPFLGKLGSTLQTLVLRGNGHTGKIPQEFGNLTGLRVLDLHGNNLKGKIPPSLGRIAGLRSLDLSCNRLYGEIPNISYPSLTVLDMNQNHLNGLLPKLLLATNSLIKIDLSRNQFSGQIPGMDGLTNLILLDLSYNALNGTLPEFLGSLKSLQSLVLAGNPSMTATIPETTFAGLNNLVNLGLSNMNLEGPIPRSLGDLTTLRVLHLAGNRLNGSIPASFAGLSGLSELRLEGNRLSGPIPLSREKIWRMGRKLSLGNNLGLCYDGLSADDLIPLSRDGIAKCVGTGISVEHVSGDGGKNIFGSTTQSGAAAAAAAAAAARNGIQMAASFLLFYFVFVKQHSYM